MFKISSSNTESARSTAVGGAMIPHAWRQKKTQNTKQKQYCNKFNRDFKNGPHPKKEKSKYLDQGRIDH